ncbi:MAG: hypothetical protein ACLU6Y_08950 [Ruminococcus sp.]
MEDVAGYCLEKMEWQTFLENTAVKNRRNFWKIVISGSGKCKVKIQWKKTWCLCYDGLG